ncbi:MAG: hypothetical protein K2Q24_14770 [Chitinophagaceae bacterium]|jgi:hypothetical protein|nr:hypothetical protein [Chitinophagaceae bacterium]
MKKYFTVYGVMMLLLFTVAGCKKNNSANTNKPFVIEIEGKSFAVDSVVYHNVYANNLSASLHNVFGYSKDKSCTIFFSFESIGDTMAVGTFTSVTNINVSRIRSFSLTTKTGSRFEDYTHYYQIEQDAKLIIGEKRPGFIAGTLNGNVTGGNPVPGGFSISSYQNIRTAPVNIRFNTAHYYFQ